MTKEGKLQLLLRSLSTETLGQSNLGEFSTCFLVLNGIKTAFPSVYNVDVHQCVCVCVCHKMSYPWKF